MPSGCWPCGQLRERTLWPDLTILAWDYFPRVSDSVRESLDRQSLADAFQAHARKVETSGSGQGPLVSAVATNRSSGLRVIASGGVSVTLPPVQPANQLSNLKSQCQELQRCLRRGIATDSIAIANIGHRPV